MEEKDKEILKNTIDSLIDSAAIEAANEMFDKIESSINDDEITFSDNHINKINQIFSSNGDISHKNSHHKINKRVLLVAIITMVITLLTAFSVVGNRLKLFDYFMNINNIETEFRSDDKIYKEEYSIGETTGITNDNIKYKVIANYIPENFQEITVEYTNSNYVITYEYQDYYFSIAKSLVPDYHDIDTENAEISYIDINGNKAFLSSKSEVKMLFWIENDILYQLDSNIDKETLIKIAENIK